ncbi:PIN domain-containing protein [Sporosarcina luteola]|uniref:PIN domain-containing protein n=1 Tax=Sporosarcina luteola TaxID=582850 RepID=UPI00203DFF90|nr:PIN domain-containing protein [Sporosarcina luteola]MCM3712013.1 PIN domain-containing protein [Sporosarcina luteola]
MTIAVFLDTNLFVKNYKMDGQEFTDLFTAHEELNKDENFKLYITEMNLHEIVDNYGKEVSSAMRHIKGFQSKMSRLADIEIGFDRKETKTKLVDEYKSDLEQLFYVSIPSAEATENAVSRLYNSEMPFRDNKEEFKDAIIWESIYEYAEEHEDEKVYLISENKKDFAEDAGSGQYRLHSDYNDLSGRIKYFKSINDFLKEIEYLKTHLFSFQEEGELVEAIEEFLNNNSSYNSAIEGAMYNFFTNNTFSDDYFEGWGADYYISKIHKVEINTDIDVLESEDYFYIPITFNAEVEYSVEIRNPMYEPGEDEFLQSPTRSIDLAFNCTAAYEIEKAAVEYVEDVEIDYI